MKAIKETVQLKLDSGKGSNMKIGSDIDGTLLDYDHVPGQQPVINEALIQEIAKRTDWVVLITNQGGLPFGVMGRKLRGGRSYPKPADFVLRLSKLAESLGAAGIHIGSMHVSVFHSKVSAEAVQKAAEMAVALLSDFPSDRIEIYTDEQSRKPSPVMLQHAEIDCYYGDSDEDAEAAKAAGVEFVHVERFLGARG
jgi:hypothetical protein